MTLCYICIFAKLLYLFLIFIEGFYQLSAKLNTQDSILPSQQT